MKLIIAGSREATNYQDLLDAIKYFSLAGKITEIISGTCRGADALGERYAFENNIPVTKMPANWGKYGRSAGPRRNEKMAKYGDELLALWDGISAGTKSMIALSVKNQISVHTYILGGNND